MARVELLPRVFEDFDRFLHHMERFDVPDAPERIAGIVQALQVLARSPLIGRPARDGKRELVIGRSGRGYIALYRYVRRVDTVFVLAMRAQRESGYAGGS